MSEVRGRSRETHTNHAAKRNYPTSALSGVVAESARLRMAQEWPRGAIPWDFLEGMLLKLKSSTLTTFMQS